MIKTTGSLTYSVSTSALILAIAAGVPFAVAQDQPDPGELIEMLQDGGYVIYLRHAQTETDYADQINAVPGNCATQRVLSEAGWEQAKLIGAAVRAANIPVGEVLSSQYCRAWQTADLAFGNYKSTDALNFEPAETYTDAQLTTMRMQVTPLLAKPPESGTNRVVVGHDDPFEAATGIYPEPQGVSYILKPDGQGSFEVLGEIAPDNWPKS